MFSKSFLRHSEHPNLSNLPDSLASIIASDVCTAFFSNRVMESRNEGQPAEAKSQAELLELHKWYAVRFMAAVAVLMVIIFSVGLRAFVMMINSEPGAFYPAIPMLLSVSLAHVGFTLKGTGKPMMITSMVCLFLAVIACVTGAVIDGTAAQRIHYTDFSLCYYANKDGYSPPCLENTTWSYQTFPRRTCVCCYQWKDSFVQNTWRQVDSCEQISSTFQSLLWTSVSFNTIGIVVCVMALATTSGYISLMEPKNQPRALPLSVYNPHGPVVMPPASIQQQLQQQQQHQQLPSPFPSTSPALRPVQFRLTPANSVCPAGFEPKARCNQNPDAEDPTRQCHHSTEISPLFTVTTSM